MEDVRYSPGVQFTLHSDTRPPAQRVYVWHRVSTAGVACLCVSLNLLQFVTEMSQTSETCHKLSPICHRTPHGHKFVTEMSLCHSASHTLHTEGDRNPIARAVSVGVGVKYVEI